MSIHIPSRLFAAVITTDAADTRNIALPMYDGFGRTAVDFDEVAAHVLRKVKKDSANPKQLLGFYIVREQKGRERTLGGVLFARSWQNVLTRQKVRFLANEKFAISENTRKADLNWAHGHALYEVLDEKGMRAAVLDSADGNLSLKHIVCDRDRVINFETGEIYLERGRYRTRNFNLRAPGPKAPVLKA